MNPFHRSPIKQLTSLVSPRMTSEQQLQKIHTDDVWLPRCGKCFWLVVPREKFASTNQEHNQDMGSERHQYGIFAVVSQTSFRKETSEGVVKCRLFFPQTIFNAARTTLRARRWKVSLERCNVPQREWEAVRIDDRLWEETHSFERFPLFNSNLKLHQLHSLYLYQRRRVNF